MLPHRNHPAATIALRVPIVILVLAATAVPVELRPFGRVALDFTIQGYDVVENILGFVPVGAVLAGLGPVWTVIAAALISTCAEASQFIMMHRVPSAIDVPVNIFGAVLGAVICAYWKMRPVEVRMGRGKAAAAVALAAAIVFTAWGDRGAVPNARGATAPGRLEARWKFDTGGGRLALDSTQNGLHGEFSGEPKYVAGVTGDALKLDGQTDAVRVSHSSAIRLVGSMTISAWINSSAFPVDDAAIVSSLGGAGGYQLDTTVDRGPRTIGFKLTAACGERVARYGATPLALNTWYHVAGVYDADARTMDVYLNGELDNGALLGPVTAVQRSSRAAVYVGRRSDEVGFEFAGALDDVQIYSRALTKAEIVAEMHGEVPEDAVHPIAQEDSGSLASWLAARPDTPCAGMSDEEDAKIPLAAVSLGVLVAAACAGLWPAAGALFLLAASLGAGLLLLPAALPTLPVTGLWMPPLLGLVGGASVAVSVRRHSSRVR